MNDDRPMRRLRDANPFPDGLPALPAERVLASVTERHGAERPRESRRARRSRWSIQIGLTAGVAVPICIAVVAILLLTGRTGDHASPSARPKPALAVPPAFRTIAGQLGVLRRAQTARDRSLPRVLAEATRRGDLRGADAGVLTGSIPTVTRYLKTLPDGREVFLVGYRGAAGAGPLAERGATVRLVFVQPGGRESGGQPISDPGGSAADTALFAEDAGGLGCFDTVYYRLAPDRVKTVRYAFPRQDANGFDYKTPLTVTVPVVNNLIATEIPDRAPCQRPSVISLYGAGGTLLGRRGSGTDLDRITRPINHGNPIAGIDLESTKPPARTDAHPATGTLPATRLSPRDQPRLIAAYGRNPSGHQVRGYIRSAQLDANDCGDVKDPAAAVRCTRDHAGKRTTIPLYASNGTTVIGTFTTGN